MRDRGVKLDVVLPERRLWADADETRVAQIDSVTLSPRRVNFAPLWRRFPTDRAPSRRGARMLCDVGLPGMNGYEVAKALRKAGTAAQLFAVSGYTQPEDVANAVAAGFDGHLAKPAIPRRSSGCSPDGAA